MVSVSIRMHVVCVPRHARASCFRPVELTLRYLGGMDYPAVPTKFHIHFRSFTKRSEAIKDLTLPNAIIAGFQAPLLMGQRQ